MAACHPPVVNIKTFNDAYNAAVINASRLNDCTIKHDGLVLFENTTNP